MVRSDTGQPVLSGNHERTGSSFDAVGSQAVEHVTSDRPADTSVSLGAVAVVGRPNVGKSALVNRIVGQRVAIVEERPGVTRDRNELETEWAGARFHIVDTGGWLEEHAYGSGSDRQIQKLVSAQTEEAIRSSSVVLLVVDVLTGVTREDEAVARLLRRHDCEVVLVVSKVDSDKREADAWEFVRLGLGDPWMVSALHGRCVGDLLDEIVRRLRSVAERESGNAEARPCEVTDGSAAPDGPAEGIPGIAIVGRPNVGKSTLFNRIAGSDRTVTDQHPGTTRDAIDTLVVADDGTLRFIDTAGMRRRSHVDSPTEAYSIMRSLRALETADVALLVIDATSGVTHQDQRIAERIEAVGRACLVVLNKWDCIDTEDRKELLVEVGEKLAFVDYASVLKISALTGKGMSGLMPAIWGAVQAYYQRVSTGELNRALRSIQDAHAPPEGRVLYAVQAVTGPPTFTLFASRPLSPQYLRYVSRKLRATFHFGPTPLKFRVRLRQRN